MTIIAGFKCNEGVVICADTQETVGAVKRHVPKLRYEDHTPHPAMRILGSAVPKNDMAVAFCGAANNGPFIDKLVDLAWGDAQATDSLEEACQAIEESIKDTYREFGRIYQPGYCPEAELIYGVKMTGKTKLFYALGPVVNEKEGYSSGGVGIYMADFLASRMYTRYLQLSQCLVLAAYVLFQAKEHVEGCGGNSEIAILRNDGTSGRINWKHTETITNLVKLADRETGSILLDYANLALNDEEFLKAGTKKLQDVMSGRQQERENLNQWNEFWKTFLKGKPFTDELGLPSNSL